MKSITTFLIGSLLVTGLHAATKRKTIAIPDFTKGDAIPKSAPHDWNLGPTGLRGWIYSDKLETSDARQIIITKVSANSPATGKLAVGDVILGVFGNKFSYDARVEFGKAITLAEAQQGKLPITIWRKDKEQTIELKLPTTGTYSPTAPFNCKKSEKIFQQGCKALTEKMKTAENLNPFERSYNCLALLASGNPNYWPVVKKHVTVAAKYTDPDRRQYHSWFYGPLTILVAEYTMATGDMSFMPQLERLALEIANGQSEVGSWGHRFIQKHNDRLAGYGMMNAPGVPLTIAMTLARKAGVQSAKLDTAIAKSELLLRFYVGKGSIPYGDHRPWIEAHDDNGKNGAAAVLFNLLGNNQATTYFSRMSVACHGAERETGHTGNFFNMLWAMNGVALSGPNATGSWLNEFGWYYDLARQSDGTYRFQGPPQQRNTAYNNWDCTGIYLLAYAMPLKKIHLTGKSPSVAAQVSKDEADKLIDDGRGWSPKRKLTEYKKRNSDKLLTGLTSWSPVVRERSAKELATRSEPPIDELIKRLKSPDLYTRTGACQALAHLKGKAAPAVPELRNTLKADDLWLRVKAAEALAAIGPKATVALPDMINRLTHSDAKNDPRAMEQRYLTFAIFSGRSGLLRHSLRNVDMPLLYKAVRASLSNQDGRARGEVASVYQKLSYEQIKPILPAIYQAVKEPAPSGIMFADGIRIKGLELLAKHNIKEGIPWCVKLIGAGRWGDRRRIKPCLNILKKYGANAKSEIPQVLAMEKQLVAKNKWWKDNIANFKIPEFIQHIKSDKTPPKLRSLDDK